MGDRKRDRSNLEIPEEELVSVTQELEQSRTQESGVTGVTGVQEEGAKSALNPKDRTASQSH